MSGYDAVIIGAGHNGLVCGAYLAQAGLRVAVLERRPVIGGCSTTEVLSRIGRVSLQPRRDRSATSRAA